MWVFTPPADYHNWNILGGINVASGKSRAYGKATRIFRKRRGLSIKEVQGHLGQATITHFETGRSDIALSSFYHLITATWTQTDEFFAAADSQDNPIHAFFNNLSVALVKDDLQALRKLRDQVQLIGDTEVPNQLVLTMLDGYIAGLQNPDFQFNNNQVAFISDYLRSSLNWFKFEYAIFIGVAPFMPFKINKKLLNHMFSAYNEFHLNIYLTYIVQIIFNICEPLLRHHNYADVTTVLKQSEPFISRVSNLLTRYRMSLLADLTSHFSHHDPKSLQNIQQTMRTIQHVDPQLYTNDAHWLESLGVKLS